MDLSDPSPSIDCYVYLDGGFVCYTPNANQDIADGDPPIVVHDTSQLQIRFRPCYASNQPEGILYLEEEEV